MITLESKLARRSRVLTLSWYVSLILLLPVGLQAQGINNDCIPNYLLNKSMIEFGIAHFKTIYNLKNHEKIASIGAGSGSREVIYAMMADSLTVYLEDIKPDCLSAETLANTVTTLHSIAGRPVTSSFTAVVGTEYQTRLPKATFDKVIIENSLHEFSRPDSMLVDIRSVLKPDGILYIWETITKKRHLKHEGCRKPYFREGPLIELLTRNGFVLLKGESAFASIPDGMMYTFKKIQ